MLSCFIRQSILVLTILAFAASNLAFTADQASNGKTIYVKHCATCHGIKGRGGTVPDKFGPLAGLNAPRLAGPGALPGMTTVGQVYDFISKNMPADKPGSLTEDEYLDIISSGLQASGIKPDGHPLTPASAEETMIPDGK